MILLRAKSYVTPYTHTYTITPESYEKYLKLFQHNNCQHNFMYAFKFYRVNKSH